MVNVLLPASNSHIPMEGEVLCWVGGTVQGKMLPQLSCLV